MFSTEQNGTHEASNSTKEIELTIINYTAVQVIFYIFYFLIFVLGIFGNILVSYIVCSNKAMQTVTNMFIMNLAFSDIMLCIMAVPFTPLYSFIGKWIFGRIICHLVPYVQASSVYVSTLTLTAIAIDRYFVIIHPFRQRMKLSTCTGIIFGIWFFSMVITLPYGIYMNILEDGMYCEENWPVENIERYFGCFTILMQCVVPFCVIAYCYIRISFRLNQRAKSRPGTKSARKEELDRERKRRTNRMLISMVTIFGICWLPWNIINLIHDFTHNQAKGSWPYFHLFFFLAHLMAMSSTCYNPFLYAWLNENFRKEFKQILPCISKRVSRRFCNGNDHTQDTLLQSTASNSAIRCLEPREPTAERNAWSSPVYEGGVRLNVMTKEETIATTETREHAL